MNDLPYCSCDFVSACTICVYVKWCLSGGGLLRRGKVTACFAGWKMKRTGSWRSTETSNDEKNRRRIWKKTNEESQSQNMLIRSVYKIPVVCIT